MRLRSITMLCCLALSASGCLILAEPPVLSDGGPETGWTDLAVDGSTVCALDADGAMWCGDGDKMQLEDEGPFVSVSAGNDICTVDEIGVLKCGYDAFDSGFELTEGYVAVSGGPDAGCGLLVTGGARCWPKASGASGPFALVGADSDFACGILRSTGSLQCWSVGDSTAEASLLDVPNGAYSQVAITDDVGCAISPFGGIVCWGSSSQGLIPGPPSGVYVDVALTWRGACAVRDSGSILCWGDNASDPNNSQYFPPSDESFIRVSLGTKRTCGITTDTRLVCWGG